MDPVLSHVLTGIGGVVIGALVSWLFLRKGSGNSAAAEKKLNEYRASVAEHFARTSALVDNMTDSYKAVFDELSEGAHKLMEPEQLKQLQADQSGEVITLSRLSYRAADANVADKPSAAPSAPVPPAAPADPVAPEPKTEAKPVKTDDKDATPPAPPKPPLDAPVADQDKSK